MEETLLDSLYFPPPPPPPPPPSGFLVSSSEDWLTEPHDLLTKASNDASLGWLLGGLEGLELPEQDDDAKEEEEQLQMGCDNGGIDTQWLLDFLFKSEEEDASVAVHAGSDRISNSTTTTTQALSETTAVECLLLHLHGDDGEHSKCKRQRRSWDWHPVEHGIHNIITSCSSSSPSPPSPSPSSSTSPPSSSSFPIVPPGRVAAWAGPTLSDVQSALAMRESSQLSSPIATQDGHFPSNIYLRKSSSKENRHMVKVTSTSDGVLEDGYRWRKYGQKLIKNSPHPRNYYKCTFPGCRVKKQTERCKVDPSNAIWVCYEGIHLHLRPNPVTSLRPQQP